MFTLFFMQNCITNFKVKGNCYKMTQYIMAIRTKGLWVLSRIGV